MSSLNLAFCPHMTFQLITVFLIPMGFSLFIITVDFLDFLFVSVLKDYCGVWEAAV